MTHGLVFDIKKYSIHDGPGIRTTVFLKGCPLSCWWCHNPESQSPQREIILRENRCIRCGACLDACPHNAITLDRRGADHRSEQVRALRRLRGNVLRRGARTRSGAR